MVACVGGGSNAMGIFHPFLEDEAVKLIGVEAGGERAREPAITRPPSRPGRPGVLHGAKSYVLQDEDGQIQRHIQHLGRAGLSGRGPGARLAERQRPGTLRDGDGRRGPGGVQCSGRTEGIIPALESAHALAYAVKLAPT